MGNAFEKPFIFLLFLNSLLFFSMSIFFNFFLQEQEQSNRQIKKTKINIQPEIVLKTQNSQKQIKKTISQNYNQ